MKTLVTPSGVKIDYYASMDELTIRRYTTLQKYLALEAGIGSNLESITSRCNKIKAYAEEDKKKDVIQEIDNLKEACLSVINGIPYNSLAFACLVAGIGSEMRQDITEDGLLATVSELETLDILNSTVQEIVEDVKKKLSQN